MLIENNTLNKDTNSKLHIILTLSIDQMKKSWTIFYNRSNVSMKIIVEGAKIKILDLYYWN